MLVPIALTEFEIVEKKERWRQRRKRERERMREKKNDERCIIIVICAHDQIYHLLSINA